MSKIHRGSPWPLGSSLTKKGVNFSVASPMATYLELLIFKNENDSIPKEIITLDKEHRSGDYWHIEVEGLKLGSFYCYRVIEERKGSEKDIYSRKILLDPCSRGITGWKSFSRGDSTGYSTNIDKCLKSVVTERDTFRFDLHPRPRHEWDDTIIYELHVGGFTKNEDSNIKNHLKGTFIGLIEKLKYLKTLGITAIELLPVFAFDKGDAPIGVNNYWGYSPLNWFTPHEGFSVESHNLNIRDQFRKLVENCHDLGIEVILDVVYNHTTEGNKKGPIISWKGFAESNYYHQNKEGEFLDVTGCGNTIAANNPISRQLILESLRCWANELGVDGFRFDLGISLARGKDLIPLDNPPIFEEIESDPLLSNLKFISEPWDCGGLYKIGDFPAKRFRTWNGHFRDDIRRFWKGDKNSTWPLKDRLMGSPEIYKKSLSNSHKSINFITSHDGFTLKDLVSFNEKHNLSNGENNRDGENHNNSFNNGVEGPTTNESINKIRSRNQKNFFATLFLAQGIPMISMGDEVGRSQGGNNNVWCQDNSLGWMLWGEENCDYDLKDFVKELIYIRKKVLGLLRPMVNPTQKPYFKSNQKKPYLQWHGVKTDSPDWGSWSNTISYSINQSKEDPIIWIGLNAYCQAMKFELPKPNSNWVKLIDTNLSNKEEQNTNKILLKQEVELESKSLVLMITQKHLRKLNL